MKKITVGFLALFALSVNVKAQDYKKVRQAMLISQVGSTGEAKLEEAKTELDKIAADPKGAGAVETELLKAEVYGTIAGNENLKAKYPDAANIAYQSFKKYLTLDPTEAKLKEDNYAGLSNIYTAFFNSGIESYNKKQWDSAYDAFNKTSDISDFFLQRKMLKASLDTNLHLYTGVTAQNSLKHDEAVKHYSMLMDANLAAPEYESMYTYVVDYYLNKNDSAKFLKYYNLGKQYYPKNDYWSSARFDFLVHGKSPSEVLSIFERENTGAGLSAKEYSQFGSYFVDDSLIRIMPTGERAPYFKKAEEAFSKAYSLDTSDVISLYNQAIVTNAQFTEAWDRTTELKGTTTDIKTKRAESYKNTDVLADKTLDQFETVYNRFSNKATRTRVEESTMKNAAKVLARTYEYKRERTKAKSTPQDYDKFDKKFKFYDTKY